MAFDYTEGNLFALNKLRALHPYFDIAIFYLSRFSETIMTPKGDNVFEISNPVIQPRIALLDDPYPIIQCRQRIFAGQKKIEISYGIFTILGMMGEFEKAIDEIAADRTKYGSLSADSMWKADISGLVRCIKDALKYLERSCNAYPEDVPEIPPLTLSTDLLNYALEFIVGHELSHYLDQYYNYDFRNNQQTEVLDNCIELLKGLKSTPYKKYADQFFELLDKAGSTDDHYFQIWSEEIQADFDGYHYLCTGVPVGYLGMRKILAISLSFVSMRIVEYFESTLDSDAPEGFFVPIKWRAVFLQYMIYKKYGSNYEYFNEFLANEWGIYQIVDTLLERALLEIRSSNGLKEDGLAEGTTDSIAQNVPLCKELIGKMSAASVSEAESVFNEIDAIFRQNISNSGFMGAFQIRKMAEILCQLGHFFYESRQYETAYKWFYRGSAYFEKSKELPGLQEADCYEQMGNLCYDMGNYGHAVGWYNETLFIQQEVLGISFQGNVAILLRVAIAMIMNGQEDSAEKLLTDILKRTDDNSIKVEVFRDLGIINDNRMDYAAALECFKMAAYIAQELFGAESLEMASLYNSLGTILSCMKEFNDAEWYLRQSLIIKLNFSDIDPISVTNSMFNLGMLELQRGCYTEALKWFKESLDIRKTCLVENHPLVADTLLSIGTTYFFQSKYDRAQDYSQRATDIFRVKLGRSHHKTKRGELLLQRIEETKSK